MSDDNTYSFDDGADEALTFDPDAPIILTVGTQVVGWSDPDEGEPILIQWNASGTFTVES